MQENRGKFITFEGVDGAGKSTQAAKLAQRLRDHGHTVRLVHEPGGTPLGEHIRHLLTNPRNAPPLTPATELLLFAASRAQLVTQIIRPALAAGEIVLCDRFTDSTLVYQGHGHGLPPAAINTLNDLATGGLHPTLTLLLDLPTPTALHRAHHRPGIPPDRLEQHDPAFYERVRAGYHALAQDNPRRIHIADATQPPEILAQHIWNELHHRHLL
ncbi:MAG: dTMP kinase [Puniceicoccales bacterium]|jgi:dTMP kinase|nr:dTMP kinase [Puniceicoccales bacterium]